ncbi:hypothetical protein [Mycobacterium sp. shizuoka-1]|uniref:hypothetical protein n=1 Tax=Mycobacterium sp. shizuoka-1 TaxID=2039281 RepID=UPI000C05E177|nr:hypothetical protein [Mycobacterium sp. shizuoka-1]GAY15966.1 hypothetical protein MSZK_26920 [Mycobacterium sp. shizuoka-1]
MADGEGAELGYAPTLTVPTIWHRLAPLAFPLAVLALGVSIWALVSDSAGGAESAGLPGDPKVRACTAFHMVTTMQTRNDLGSADASLALVGAGDYLLRQLDADTPTQLADAIRAFARSLQDIGMNALAGVHASDPRQAARQAEGDFDRKQVADLCS